MWLSFLMVDHLIERGGFARLVEYFRAFTLSSDRVQNFQRVFGVTLAAFEHEVLDALAWPRR